MTHAIDVLVLGDVASDDAAVVLAEHGHRVHRCHEVGEPAFPCVGVTDPGSCPLVGTIDVALLVRRGIQPRPLAEEAGAACAIRAGIPIVEDGLDVHDPYASWITARVGIDRDLVTECLLAAETKHDELRALIIDRIGRLVGGVGVDPTDVVCHVESEPAGIRVDLTVPVPIERSLQQAIAVRVLDAVRATPRNHGQVNVDVRGVTS